jgi:DNA-binding HxlR family transcriptional regulator
MLRADYDGQNCSVARTLELVGERWTILILRDAFFGINRFDDFQRRLGIARNTLQSRLERLVDAGLMRRVRYQERPDRFEYRLTRAGVDLWPTIVSLMHWGDSHAAAAGPPVIITHKDCGGEIDDRRRCERCGADVEAWDAEPKPGPGATAGQRPAAAA